MNTIKKLQPPAHGLYRISIRDYLLNHHAQNTENEHDVIDIEFHIGAPDNELPKREGMHLFIDPADCLRRQLPTDAWQIHAEPSITSNDFHLWAQQVVQLMLEAMLGKNMIGFEFISELRNLLRQTTEQRIVLQHVPLDNAEQLSERIAASGIEHAWLALFSRSLPMNLYSRMATLFEQHIPDEGRFLSSANTLDKGEDCLMLMTVQARQ